MNWQGISRISCLKKLRYILHANWHSRGLGPQIDNASIAITSHCLGSNSTSQTDLINLKLAKQRNID